MNSILDDKIEHGTFCALPWIEEFKTPDGQKQLCCISTDRITDTQHVESRKKLWNGERISTCSTCWKLEDQGVVSQRQFLSREWIRNTDQEKVVNYFNQFTETSYPPPELLYYDLRYNSTCNLACIMCSPDYSSLWKKELGIAEGPANAGHDPAKILATAQKIDFLGGEPFVIEEYIDLLKFLSENNNNIRINIFTNLTALKPEILSYIKRLNASLIISIDSWGSVQEYHRYPLRWNKFITNLNTVKEEKIRFSFNTVASAISIFGWEKFGQLESYGPYQWSIIPVTTPPSLQIKNIPPHLKQQAYDSVYPMTLTDTYSRSPLFKDRIDYILKETQAPGDPELLYQSILGLDQRRNINHQDYLGINLIHNP